MADSTGNVRSARKIPPMPTVSPMVWRRPNRPGTSKSTTVAGYPPTWIELMMKSAPSRACRRSRYDVITGAAPRPLAVARAMPSAVASLSTSMSCRWIFRSGISPNAHRSALGVGARVCDDVVDARQRHDAREGHPPDLGAVGDDDAAAGTLEKVPIRLGLHLVIRGAPLPCREAVDTDEGDVQVVVVQHHLGGRSDHLVGGSGDPTDDDQRDLRTCGQFSGDVDGVGDHRDPSPVC